MTKFAPSRVADGVTVADLMTPNPRFLHLENTLLDAAALMSELDVGVLFVVDGDALRGVVTDRDIALRGCRDGLDPATTKIEEVMTPDVVHLRANTHLDDALKAMMRERIRRVAITDSHGQLRGVLSLADIVRAIPHYALASKAIAHISHPFAAPKNPVSRKREQDAQESPSKPGQYTSLPHVPATNPPATERR